MTGGGMYIPNLGLLAPGRYKAEIYVQNDGRMTIAIDPGEEWVGPWDEYPMFVIGEKMQ